MCLFRVAPAHGNVGRYGGCHCLTVRIDLVFPVAHQVGYLGYQRLVIKPTSSGYDT